LTASRLGRGNDHGGRRLPANLPREQKVIDLPEEEKPCPRCGKQRVCIGEEISEKLDYGRQR
jgi:transposase